MASISRSTSVSRPSTVRMPRGVISSIADVISSALSGSDRPVVRARHDLAFAQWLVVRREPVAQLAVPDLCAQTPARVVLGQSATPARFRGDIGQDRGAPQQPVVQPAVHRRHPAQDGAQQGGLGQFHRRPHHPLRGPHEVGDVGGLALQGGHDLHSGGTVPEDGDSAAAGRDVVVPPRGVHDVAAECVEPRDVRRKGMMQHTGCGDHEVGFQLCAVSGGDLPPRPGEDGRDDFGIQLEANVETEPFDDVAEVTLDLIARGEHASPVGFRRERELVELRRHVARQPGVAIPVPDSADVRALLQNGEIMKTVALQRHRGGDAQRDPRR